MVFFYPSIAHEMRHIMRLMRPWRALIPSPEVESSVQFGKEKFQAHLDVQHFKPESINIKVSDDNMVTVEGKHEEQQDGYGYVSRHFVRRFILPKGHDMSKVESVLSTDGVLTITAPRIAGEEDQGRQIPITKTGKSFKNIEGKKTEGEDDKN